ncbi:MAG: PepSY domain-containing protein, partial [Pleurocapsa sp. SU_196_0]|nr:PepSY domain-containing protein [Pleurocapsa sp. SU_196_0]
MTTLPQASLEEPRADGVPASSLANKLYLTVWRWHFYSGLYVIPFMIMLALTGLVILFQPQLEAVQYRDRLFVTPPATTASLENPLDLAQPYTAQLEAVRRAYPGAELGSFTPPTAPNRSAQVLVTPKDAPQRTVFVDPYTARVLGDVQNNARWGSVAETIHGTLLLGKTGDRLIEIAAGLGVILLVSGLYLWWPRGRNGLYGVLIPRFNAGRRTMWRDLHAVPGFWIGGALIAFLITGLSWTGVWGEQFTQAWNTFPSALWNDVPKSTRRTSASTPTRNASPGTSSKPRCRLGFLGGQGRDSRWDTRESGQRDRLCSRQWFSQGFTVDAPGDKDGVWTV